jgi:hypothetical protein
MKIVNDGDKTACSLDEILTNIGRVNALVHTALQRGESIFRPQAGNHIKAQQALSYEHIVAG